MINLWFHEAGRFHGLPVEDRTAVEMLSDPILSAVFEREGNSIPTTGTLSLFMGDEKVDECPS